MDAHTSRAQYGIHQSSAVVHVHQESRPRVRSIMYVSDEGEISGIAQPRNLIVLDRFAKATVIESYATVARGPARTSPTQSRSDGR